jgi:2-polyprenyl-3-methyl-5-hydroxy-6-metoxy-1,4-benzoquinol methylase
MTEAKEMAIHGTHDIVLAAVQAEMSPGPDKTIVDIGAGQGALSSKLHQAGFNVVACDLFPENFKVPGVRCLGVDVDGTLPFEDASLDCTLAVELLEHIDNHRNFFSEVHRVLKPGGKFLFTTPNILSLKSRFSFLLTGYFYFFGTLNPEEYNPMKQHISPFTIDRYVWMLSQSGLKFEKFKTDKFQKSSFWLFPLLPFIKVLTKIKQGDSASVRLQNSPNSLFGRKLIIVAQKER